MIRIFNKDTNLRYKDIENKTWFNNFYQLPINKLVFLQDMSAQEKKDHPYAEITGGYLKTLSYKDAWKELWQQLSKDAKAEYKTIPNFDSKLFEEITGIKIKA